MCSLLSKKIEKSYPLSQPSELSKIAITPTINLYGVRARNRAPMLLGLFFMIYGTTPTTLVHDIFQTHPSFMSLTLGVVSAIFRSLSPSELEENLHGWGHVKDSGPYISIIIAFCRNLRVTFNILRFL